MKENKQIVELPLSVANNFLRKNIINDIIDNLNLTEFKLFLLIISHRDMLVHLKSIKENQKFSFPIKKFKQYYSKHFSRNEIKSLVDNLKEHKYIKSIELNTNDEIIVAIDKKFDKLKEDDEVNYKINLDLIKENNVKFTTMKIIFLLNYHKNLKLHREHLLDFLGYKEKSKEQRKDAVKNIKKVFKKLEESELIADYDYHKSEKYFFSCKSLLKEKQDKEMEDDDFDYEIAF
ncbi:MULTISPECIES: hypothetical protein [Vibrio]|uniref:hypothetical protein n=1 Tax=Vibrio TaxID=662 RepID=UPI000306C58F|nr:hypothetical protein [Vibrio harveyi]